MTSVQIDIRDGLSSSTAIKGPVRCATTANITLSGEQIIDGIAVVTDERVLVKNQTTGSDNGIWICDTGPWRRAKDFNKTRDVKTGTLVLVNGGTTGAGIWQVTAADPISIGSSSIAFSATTITAAQAAVLYQPKDADLTAWAAVSPLGTADFALMGNGASSPSFKGFLQAGTGAATRTWQSKASDWVSILDFGAIGDGNVANASANATALTNALATGKKVWIPYTSAGYHFGTNQITVGTGKSIEGESQVLLKSTATTSLFYITSFEVLFAPAVIKGLKIDMTGSGAASTGIRFATALGIVAGAQLSELLFTNCVEAIGDEVHATNYVVDVKMYDIRCLVTRGRQIYIRRSRGFIWIDTMRVDQTAGSGQTVTPVTWNSAQFEDFIGLEINRFDSVGPVTTTYQSTVYGLYINGTVGGQSSVWLNRILVDNTSGNGIGILNANYLCANWIEGFQNLGNQIFIDTITESQLSNVFAHGAVGVTGAAAGANGVTIQNSTEVAVSNLHSNSNTGAGLSVAGTALGVNVSNLQAKSNTGFGLVLANSADHVNVSGGYMASNGGTVSNSSSGTHNRIEGVGGYNPVGPNGAVTTTASPWTYTAGTSPETLYIAATTSITQVTQNGTTVLPQATGANGNFTIQLGPNEVAVVTYTGTLGAKKMVH
jgi:uncharacterized cupin superfamily protein